MLGLRQTFAMVFGAAGVLAIAGASQGAYVTMTLNSVSPKQSISTSQNGGSSWQTLSAGVFNWTGVLTNPAGLQGSFKAFCIELTQTVSTGTTYSNTYQAIPLATGPLPAAAPDQPMGADSAQLIGNLFDTRYAGLSTANDYAAFQLSIWEIIYDSGLSLSSGNFRMRNNNTVQTLAQGWLNALDKNALVKSNLYALSSTTRQDMVVPAPGAGAALAAGLLIAPLRRRRTPAAA